MVSFQQLMKYQHIFMKRQSHQVFSDMMKRIRLSMIKQKVPFHMTKTLEELVNDSGDIHRMVYIYKKK